MTERERLASLWRYYGDMARQRGLKYVNPPGDGSVPEDLQANYSMWWYYLDHTDPNTGEPKGLRDIALAFLGDRAAMARLRRSENKEKETRRLDENAKDDWNEGAVPGFSRQPRDCCIEGKDPNPSQKAAILLALTQPVSFIKGPPGTGKTATILNLISCIAQNTGSDGRRLTAAILSSNNSALDNIRDAVNGFCDACPNQNRLKSSFAPLGSSEKREAFNEQLGNRIPGRKFSSPFRLCYPGRNGPFSYERVAASELSKRKERAAVTVKREEKISAKEFLAEFPIITSTVHSLQNCFADGTEYQYDYVIIDESSQLDPVVGLTAMSAARHLVLVGDSDQLPPVLDRESADRLNDSDAARALHSDDKKLHHLAAGRSFLDVCLEIFAPEGKRDCLKITLNEHYRCVPGIFQFCNDYIYNAPSHRKQEETGEEEQARDRKRSGEEIIIKRKAEGCNIPIKVLWFEGKYSTEGYDRPEGAGTFRAAEPDRKGKLPPSIRHNQKQVSIFLEEELEYLKQYLLDNKDRENGASVCVLTPFRGLLKDLRHAVEARGFSDWCRENGIYQHWSDLKDRKNKTDQEDPEDPEDPAKEEKEDAFWASTVHKSQGQEFDIVYLLPVEDGIWEWPWSQGRQLVNVAVSRARDELRIIVSSTLMDETTQKTLEEEKLLQGGRVGPDRGKNGGSRENQKRAAQELYIQKLVTYVRDMHLTPPTGPNYLPGPHPAGFPQSEDNYPFGFHKTRLVSIFDRAACIKAKKDGRKKGEPPCLEMSAPEQCLWDALLGLDILRERSLRIYCEVPLWDLLVEETRDEETLDKRLAELLPKIHERSAEIRWKPKKLKKYCRSARVDFVICDSQGHILLTVEVDGDQHQHHRYWYNAVRTEAAKGFSRGRLPEHIRKFTRWVRKRFDSEDPSSVQTDDGVPGDPDQLFAELDKLKKPAKALSQTQRDPWDWFPYKDLLDLWARQQRDRYAEKDRVKELLLTEVLHADVYGQGNRKSLYEPASEQEPDRKPPAGVRADDVPELEKTAFFPFIRLSTDGSSCLEVRDLRPPMDQTDDQILDELLKDCFTLEDLIERQLRCPDLSGGSRPTYRPKSLTVFCRDVRGGANTAALTRALQEKMLNGIAAKGSQRKKKEKYLTTDPGAVFDNAPPSVSLGHKWPTPGGQKHGISLACRADNGKLIVFPVYSHRAAENFLLRLIEDWEK